MMICPDCGAECVWSDDEGLSYCLECGWAEPVTPLAKDDEDLGEPVPPKRKWPPLPFFRYTCGYPADSAMLMIAHQRRMH